MDRATSLFEASEPRASRLTILQGCALLVLYGYLVSPLVIQAWLAGWQAVLDVLFLFNLGTSLLWLVLIHYSTRNPAIFHFAVVPLYISTAVDLFLCANFGARLSSGYFSIMLTNHANAQDFLLAYARPVALTLSVLLVAYIPSLVALRNCRKPASWRMAVLAGGLLLVIYGSVIARGISQGAAWDRAALDLAAHETSAPMGAVFQATLAAKLHVDSSELRDRRASHSFGASKAPSAAEEIYVWIVGESSRPANWSLFGYDRDTTPRLRITPGLVAFPHMMTTAPHTAVAVPSMLSLRPITDWPSIQAEQSIVGAFNEAGFKTYWLSMQDADIWSGIVPQVAAEAKYRRYFDRGYDGKLLEEFHKILNSSPGSKLFIVLHTKGSHFDYARRYPPEFARFVSNSGTRHTKMLDTYDNSILYTDWFLTEVINTLASRNGQAAVVYASDHGENLVDDDKHLLGHAIGNAYDLQTAAFMWFSAGTRHAHAGKIQNAEQHSGSQLSLSDLPHSLLDLAGIQAHGLDVQRSLFSPSFEPRLRSYIVRGKLQFESATATR